MIYVYTCILNGFDNPRPPAAPASDFARYISFTNVPNLPRVTPWEYRPCHFPGLSNARASRVPKILPHLMLPKDAEYSIYHDGNFQLRQDPIETIETLLDDKHQWAAHKHPMRSCVYTEAEIVVRDCPLVDSDSVQFQVARYRDLGFPENAGLWANGFLVRRHTPEVAQLNEIWWEEFSNGSERDQLSFPVARCKAGMEIKTINANIFSSPWVLFRWHAAWKHKEDNPDYWKERNETRDRLTKLARLTGSDSGIAWLDY